MVSDDKLWMSMAGAIIIAIDVNAEGIEPSDDTRVVDDSEFIIDYSSNAEKADVSNIAIDAGADDESGNYSTKGFDSLEKAKVKVVQVRK
jgi:hypothetical protein